MHQPDRPRTTREKIIAREIRKLEMRRARLTQQHGAAMTRTHLHGPPR
jgi:hypothetical protein